MNKTTYANFHGVVYVSLSGGLVLSVCPSHLSYSFIKNDLQLGKRAYCPISLLPSWVSKNHDIKKCLSCPYNVAAGARIIWT